jgi:hypothetical protein
MHSVPLKKAEKILKKDQKYFLATETICKGFVGSVNACPIGIIHKLKQIYEKFESLNEILNLIGMNIERNGILKKKWKI